MKSVKLLVFFLVSLLVTNANAQVENFIKDNHLGNIKDFNGYCITTTQGYVTKFGERVPKEEVEREMRGVWYDDYGFKIKELLSAGGATYEIINTYDDNRNITKQDIFYRLTEDGRIVGDKKLSRRKVFSYDGDVITIKTYNGDGEQRSIEKWTRTTREVQMGSQAWVGGATQIDAALNPQGFPENIVSTGYIYLAGTEVQKTVCRVELLYNEHNDVVSQTYSYEISNREAKHSLEEEMNYLESFFGININVFTPEKVEYRDYVYDSRGNWITRYMYSNGKCIKKEERQFVTEEEYLAAEKAEAKRNVKKQVTSKVKNVLKGIFGN